MTSRANVVAFSRVQRRRLPLPVAHAYSHLCACIVCRTIHADRMSDIRDAIYRCREALKGTAE